MSERRHTTIALRAVGSVRIGLGLTVVAVIGYAYVLNVAQGLTNPFDYFGYFTNLTSMLTCGVLVATGAGNLQGQIPPVWLVSLRAIATACMLVVGLIYNTLVPGTGAAPPWVSMILHLIFPLYAALDWVLVGDRPALPWRRLWIVLPYPVLWLAVVLARGATDGWVPYGFLLPERGILSLGLHVVGLFATLLAAGTLVWGFSRFPGVRPLGELRRAGPS